MDNICFSPKIKNEWLWHSHVQPIRTGQSHSGQSGDPANQGFQWPKPLMLDDLHWNWVTGTPTPFIKKKKTEKEKWLSGNFKVKSMFRNHDYKAIECKWMKNVK